MAKRVVAVVSSLITACLMIIFFLWGQKMNLFGTGTKAIKYREDPEPVINPYMGYAPDSLNTRLCDEASLVYINLLWSELEPEEGEYDWDYIEEKYLLDRWRSAGKNLVLRFVCDLPSNEEHMDIPQWLYDKTGDGEFYDIEYGKGYGPDYNNEVFIEEHGKVIAEIGKHFEGDGFLRYVELGSLGHWGEWHTYYPAGIPRIPKQAVREKYVAHYRKAFPYAKLLMRRTFNELPEGWGVFNDMTGHGQDTFVWLTWIESGGDYDSSGEKNGLKAVPEIWNTAPVGGEFTSSIPMSDMLGLQLEETLKNLDRSHMTFIGPKVPDPKKSGDIKEPSDKVLKKVGYRYRVSKLSMKTPFMSKETNLSLTVTNDGVAPIYFDHVMCMYIELPEGSDSERFLSICNGLGKEGTEAEGMLRFEMPFSLMEMTQGAEKKFDLTLPKDLLEYVDTKIYVGIEDAGTGVPFVKLDMKQPRTENLSLLWQNN